MRKIIIILVLKIITSSYGFSQTSVWQISKDDKKIYLGGSVHALRVNDFPLPREFDVAFMNANVLVLEADVKAPEALKRIDTEGILPDKFTLKSIITKPQYQIIRSIANELRVPIQTIDKMSPGMAIMVLNTIALQKLNISKSGVDSYYYDNAATYNKDVDFLESIDFQINLICNIPFDIDEYIKYSEIGIKKMRTEFSKLIKDWRKGKNEIIEKQITEMKKKYPSVYKAMLSDRNYKWLPKIEKYFEDDKTRFVVVGVAHLWGEDGLLNLLEEKGYEIKQLQLNK